MSHNPYNDYAFMETYKIKIVSLIADNKLKVRKTGICQFCGKATSKKSKSICLECSYTNIKNKYKLKELQKKNKNGKIR